jgi:hypothetical protein
VGIDLLSETAVLVFLATATWAAIVAGKSMVHEVLPSD